MTLFAEELLELPSSSSPLLLGDCQSARTQSAVAAPPPASLHVSVDHPVPIFGEVQEVAGGFALVIWSTAAVVAHERVLAQFIHLNTVVPPPPARRRTRSWAAPRVLNSRWDAD